MLVRVLISALTSLREWREINSRIHAFKIVRAASRREEKTGGDVVIM